MSKLITIYNIISNPLYLLKENLTSFEKKSRRKAGIKICKQNTAAIILYHTCTYTFQTVAFVCYPNLPVFLV